MSDKISCPNCGKMIAYDSKFCGFCGSKVVLSESDKFSDGTVSFFNEPVDVDKTEFLREDFMEEVKPECGGVCRSCGHKLPKTAKFCGMCGSLDIMYGFDEDKTTGIGFDDEFKKDVKPLVNPVITPVTNVNDGRSRTPEIRKGFRPAGDL